MFQSCMNNKIENSQADFSTLSTKTPEIQFCHLFLYCKLRTLRNSERKSPRHPHLLLTNQHKNADVSFIYLRSFLPEISWVRSSKLPPLLRGGNKLDSASTCTKQSGEPGHVDVVGSVDTIRLPRIDVVGSVNTIRLRRYGWNTSTEGSLRRKKEEEK